MKLRKHMFLMTYPDSKPTHVKRYFTRRAAEKRLKAWQRAMIDMLVVAHQEIAAGLINSMDSHRRFVAGATFALFDFNTGTTEFYRVTDDLGDPYKVSERAA